MTAAERAAAWRQRGEKRVRWYHWLLAVATVERHEYNLLCMICDARSAYSRWLYRHLRWGFDHRQRCPRRMITLQAAPALGVFR